MLWLKPGAWQGPIRSGYGWHLVLVDAIEIEPRPGVEEVEPDVKSAWFDQRQRELKKVAFEAMRARYTVVMPPIETVETGRACGICRRQSRPRCSRSEPAIDTLALPSGRVGRWADGAYYAHVHRMDA